MRYFTIRRRTLITIVVLVAFAAQSAAPALAKSPVKLQKWAGEIDFSPDGISTFVLAGNASHLGRFDAYGEVEFVPGEEDGSLIGDGVVVFEAANGDLLVGDVTWEAAAADEDDLSTSRMHFAWRDFVEFSDGTVMFNTGRFVEDRPPGLVVIAIIAILIGLLVPAVQK